MKNGSRFEPSNPRLVVSIRPSTRNQPRTASTNTTRTNCTEELALEPTTLRRVNTAMSTKAAVRPSTSTTNPR